MGITERPGAKPPRLSRGRRREGVSRRTLVALGAAATVVVLLASAAVWADGQVSPSSHGRPVTFEVPAGATVSGLGPSLAREGVIGDVLLWRLYLHLKGAPELQPGDYQLRAHEPFADLLAAFARGPSMERVVIPPGFTLAQIARRIGSLPGYSTAGFLSAAARANVGSPYLPPGSHDLEGLLYPDTYVFPDGTRDAAIIQMMVDRFDQAASQLGVASAPARVGVSPYQALIVASMVEREARLPADRGKVARVVYNRLKAGMKLQIDATVIYAMGGNAGPLLSGANPASLAPGSPFNTYRVSGLPPAPIASPGAASIRAALAPTPGPWLYYVVVSKNGAEAFSSTLAGQDQNIALARSRGLS